uniref:Uncharacterized protein n=1 Tax=Cacopsylla melanoneura TaxID=428564 RepID=A0A8D8RDR1_9HEMI
MGRKVSSLEVVGSTQVVQNNSPTRSMVTHAPHSLSSSAPVPHSRHSLSFPGAAVGAPVGSISLAWMRTWTRTICLAWGDPGRGGRGVHSARRVSTFTGVPTEARTRPKIIPLNMTSM